MNVFWSHKRERGPFKDFKSTHLYSTKTNLVSSPLCYLCSALLHNSITFRFFPNPHFNRRERFYQKKNKIKNRERERERNWEKIINYKYDVEDRKQVPNSAAEDQDVKKSRWREIFMFGCQIKMVNFLIDCFMRTWWQIKEFTSDCCTCGRLSYVQNFRVCVLLLC